MLVVMAARLARAVQVELAAVDLPVAHSKAVAVAVDALVVVVVAVHPTRFLSQIAPVVAVAAVVA
jgi:hypothetical protein